MYNCTKEIDKNVITLFTRDGKSFALEQLKLKVKSIQKSHVWCTKVKRWLKAETLKSTRGKKKRERERKKVIFWTLLNETIHDRIKLAFHQFRLWDAISDKKIF